jgi:hypothetical protein
MAGGITQGTSSIPRHFRWPLAGSACSTCARMKPISAFATTAPTAKSTLCQITAWKVSRVSRKLKFSRPMKRVMRLFSIDR